MKWKDVNELCAKTVEDVQDGWRVSKHFRVYVTNDGFFGLWVVRCTSSIHQRIMEPHFFYIETKMWFLNIFQCLKVGILFGSANLDMIPKIVQKCNKWYTISEYKMKLRATFVSASLELTHQSWELPISFHISILLNLLPMYWLLNKLPDSYLLLH